MKKFAGMMPPTFVLAEDGKKGDFAPPPSPFIVRGAVEGFRMRSSGDGNNLTKTAAPAGRNRRTAKHAVKALRKRSQAPRCERALRHAKTNSATVPAKAAPMCDH